MIDLDRFATKGEAAAARRLVSRLLDRGLAVSVNDGEEWTVKRSRDRDAILAALASTGSDLLRAHRPNSDGTFATVGSFWLIYGNDPDGSELVADHTDNELCTEIAA